MLSIALLTAACLALAGAPVRAAGSLDPAFGGTGKVTTRVGASLDTGSAAAVQPDGRVVVVGSTWTGSQYAFVVARYGIDGRLDPSFGNGGIVVTGGIAGHAFGVALQPDGRIVVAGSGYMANRGVFALARYRPNGSLDASFGTNGLVATPVGTGDAQPYALALAPDGKFVTAGVGNAASGEVFAVARHNADGSPDTTFNGTGWVTTAIGTLESMAQAVLVQPDGKIVAVGWGSSGPGAPFFALARYNLDGTRDIGFGSLGVATSTLGSTYAQAWAAALQPDGKILAGGDIYNSGGLFALARYNANGALDPSFSGGYVTTRVQANAGINALAVQPNGRIVAGGSSGATLTGNPWAFALARYAPDGSLDATFGNGGQVNTLLGTTSDSISALALQHDGQVLAVGSSAYGDGQQAIALARYTGDAPSPVTVVEFYNADLDNYFITGDPVEQAFVDSGAVGRWQRTGLSFKAGGVALVCRFGGNGAVNPATGVFFGPNSHFYTADFDECAQLKSLFDAHAKSWRFESYDFAVTPAIGGACAAGSVPVYRAYNNGFARGVDSNHRFTTSLVEYQKMIQRGWLGESIVYCAGI